VIVGDDTRLIDRWFPVGAVDEACGTPAGSGRVEKAVFSWFASRPIAQARAAAMTALLPSDETYKPIIETAIRLDDQEAMFSIAKAVQAKYGGKPPVVLDMFSGRGIIPLEAARAGASAIGIDLSPVATLAGRLLAEFPARDWDSQPALPFAVKDSKAVQMTIGEDSRPRLVRDVEAYLAEVGRRVAGRVAAFYPRNKRGDFPWGYIWSTIVPCDECKREFPLLGSFALRHPSNASNDAGQSLHFEIGKDSWSVSVVDGNPTQSPSYASGTNADGKKKKGKTARCFFCKHVHTLESIKAKGEAGEYKDVLLSVADTDELGKPYFRLPTKQELAAATSVSLDVDYGWPYRAVPDEVIPSGNVHTVMASGYGFKRFGQLMCDRQTRLFIETCESIREAKRQAELAGISPEYAAVLASYAAATLCRKLRRSTRGARLLLHGSADGSKRSYVQTDHIFANESKLNFQFDYFETGPGDGAGTWGSVSSSTVTSLQKVMKRQHVPCRLKMASATALPFRDGSVDVVITDPPYYDMIEYADASDLFHVWLKRVLFDAEPDLFGPHIQLEDGLQDKNQEIIVRRVHEPKRVKHDTAFYESMLAKSFVEARRVLKSDGHLIVMFGHSDPDAWRRLLGALQTAGFVVTSAWPSRTESANTGVASIKVTVTIGCRVAAANRALGIGAEVDREVVEAVVDRVLQWDLDGLALEDQLMASYGPAMEVYGRYSRVINPDGTDADLDHYLALARRAVRDAIPLETFDAITRFALFWLRAKGRAEVPKGEALFFAQADELHLDDLRDRILIESKAGFQLRLVDAKPITDASSMFEVVRAMAHAWDIGGMEAVAATIAIAGLEPNNQHLWAVVGDLANNLPASDKTAKALAGIKRSSSTISTLVGSVQSATKQSGLFDTVGA
jgi:putative DNA methylase